MRRPTATPVLACLLLLLSHGAQAEAPPNAVAVNDANLAAVDALIQQDRSQGTLPRWSNAADRPALAAFWDTTASLGQPPYRAADVAPLVDILNKHLPVFNAYLYFVGASGTVPDPGANVSMFQDEIVRSMAFMVANSAALLPALADFWDHLPEQERTETRKKGVRQVRQGQVMMMSGITLALGGPGLRPDNAATLADSLGRHGAALAGALTLRDRAALVAAVHSAAGGRALAAQAQVADFVAAMSNPACMGLCTVE